MLEVDAGLGGLLKLLVRFAQPQLALICQRRFWKSLDGAGKQLLRGGRLAIVEFDAPQVRKHIGVQVVVGKALAKILKLPLRRGAVTRKIRGLGGSEHRLCGIAVHRIVFEQLVELRAGFSVAVQLHQRFAVVEASLVRPSIVGSAGQHPREVIAGRLPPLVGIVVRGGPKEIRRGVSAHCQAQFRRQSPAAAQVRARERASRQTMRLGGGGQVLGGR